MRLFHWLKAKVPTRDDLLANKWTHPFAEKLGDPNVWHFNRRSVARGVALGMFCGIMVPLAQTPVAALFVVSLRANLAVAALCTFITNPVTTPVIWAAAYYLGSMLMGWGAPSATALADRPHELGNRMWEVWQTEPFWTAISKSWDMMNGIPLPLSLGLLVISTVASVLGYVGINMLWRIWVRQRWQHRHQRHHRRQRAAARDEATH